MWGGSMANSEDKFQEWNFFQGVGVGLAWQIYLPERNIYFAPSVGLSFWRNPSAMDFKQVEQGFEDTMRVENLTVPSFSFGIDVTGTKPTRSCATS